MYAKMVTSKTRIKRLAAGLNFASFVIISLMKIRHNKNSNFKDKQFHETIRENLTHWNFRSFSPRIIFFTFNIGQNVFCDSFKSRFCVQ